MNPELKKIQKAADKNTHKGKQKQTNPHLLTSMGKV